MKKILKISLYIILLSVICVYLGVVFVLPKIMNSKFVINKLQSVIYNKTKIETKITGVKLKVSPVFVVDFKVDSVDFKTVCKN